MGLDPDVESTIWGLVYLALAILLISGALAGVRQGKFVLGRRLGFSPYPVCREKKPVMFWVVAATLAGLGMFSLFVLIQLRP